MIDRGIPNSTQKPLYLENPAASQVPKLVLSLGLQNRSSFHSPSNSIYHGNNPTSRGDSHFYSTERKQETNWFLKFEETQTICKGRWIVCFKKSRQSSQDSNPVHHHGTFGRDKSSHQGLLPSRAIDLEEAKWSPEESNTGWMRWRASNNVSEEGRDPSSC